MSMQATYGLREHIEGVIGQAPWWLCSALVHLVLIAILATITFTTIEPPAHTVPIRSGLEPIDERVPSREIDIFSPEPGEPGTVLPTAGPDARRADDTFKEIKGAVPEITVPGPDESDLTSIVGRRRISSLWNPFSLGSGFPSPTIPVQNGNSGTIADAMDSLAEHILKAITQRYDLLVVLLFDESRSLLEDRHIMMQKITRVTGDLKLKPEETERLKWAVVSYGYKPTLWMQPTSNMAELLQAIKQVKIDETGVENVCAAISLACKTLGPLGRKMYLVVITDEEGDDTHNEKAYTQALKNLQATNSRLFVFGRESLFQQQNAFEWLRDSKGERVGPWFWAQRGVESCQQEFFTTDWLFNHHRTGRQVGAGFGCWSLSTLAEMTKGTFYILSEVSSAYDENDLGKYRPEWVTPAEYAERTMKSKMRATLRRVIDDWRKADPPPTLWQFDQLKKERDEAIARGEKALKFVEAAIPEMEVLRARRAAEKYARERWQANYDLVLAELYKFRFMLRDYVAVLRETRTAGFPKPRPDQRFNHYRILYNTTLTQPHTGARGTREWEQAKAAFDEIQKTYYGTPWAEAAKFGKTTMAPITIFPAFDVTGTWHEGTGKVPPKS